MINEINQMLPEGFELDENAINQALPEGFTIEPPAAQLQGPLQMLRHLFLKGRAPRRLLLEQVRAGLI
jgi:hypothetical protein